MKTILLTQHKLGLVDDEDFEVINSFKWCAHQFSSQSFRAMRREWDGNGKSHIVYMHRQILGLPKGDGRLVDHVNGDPLDNRRNNLRLATKSSNAWNRGKAAHNKSGFKGVSWAASRGVWVAQIVANKKHRFLGYFLDPKVAHEAYSVASRELHGEFARNQ